MQKILVHSLKRNNSFKIDKHLLDDTKEDLEKVATLWSLSGPAMRI